jgi:hypothetical protein
MAFRMSLRSTWKMKLLLKACSPEGATRPSSCPACSADERSHCSSWSQWEARIESDFHEGPSNYLPSSDKFNINNILDLEVAT